MQQTAKSWLIGILAIVVLALAGYWAGFWEQTIFIPAAIIHQGLVASIKAYFDIPQNKLLLLIALVLSELVVFAALLARSGAVLRSVWHSWNSDYYYPDYTGSTWYRENATLFGTTWFLLWLVVGFMLWLGVAMATIGLVAIAVIKGQERNA